MMGSPVLLLLCFTASLQVGTYGKNVFNFQILEEETHINVERTKVSLDKLSNATNICPDKKFFCSVNRTCCNATNNKFACCPYVQGVCCQDKIHCCPRGSRCDIPNKRCVIGLENGFTETSEWNAQPMRRTLPEEIARVGTVECPGGTSSCPDGNTCCLMAGGQYGCCPLPKAVCCSDKTHCCPNGYTCDVAAGTCKKGLDVVPFLTKQPAYEIENPTKVVCPGGQFSCSDGSTCCELSSGQYGCCPYAKAVCCSDKIHCCPNGYKCSVSAGSCTKGNHVINWMPKQKAAVESKPLQASIVYL